MENNRPLSREKKVGTGTGSVEKRGNGLGTGAHSQRQGGQSQKTGTGSSKNAGGSSSSNRAGGRKPPSLLTIVIAIVLVLAGGGTGLSGILGGSGNQNLSGGVTNATLDESVSKDARQKRTVIKGNGEDQITIMVYMCGTDLESKHGMATADMTEMQNATLSSNINLLVYTGGCSSWKNTSISSSTNQIYQIKDGKVVCLESDLGSKAMTDPATLTSFIQYGMTHYEANRYDLIFWDHGGGSISGYGYDEVHKNNGSMTLDKIDQALKNGGCTFDFIGFDACLMATLETALMVDPYADYLIASEETEPGIGWYYMDWLTKLSKNPSMSTLEIGKNIIDDFNGKCAERGSREQTTLSLIDLAEISATVPDKLKNFALSTTELIQSDSYKTVSDARANTKEFAKSSQIDQVDLIHLAQNVGTKEGKELAEALKSAVKYNQTSKNVSNAYGISIYFPYGKVSKVNQMTNTYEKIGLDASYSECIKSFASLEAAGQVASGGNSDQMNSLFDALLSGGSGFSIGNIDPQAVSQLLGNLISSRDLSGIGLSDEESAFLDEETLTLAQTYVAENQFDPAYLSLTDKNGEKVISMPEEQWSLIQNIELNVFVDDGEGYLDLGLDNVFTWTEEGDLEASYDGTWLALNGQIVAYYMLTSEGDSSDYEITGYIPALLNGDEVELMVSFTDEKPEGTILGARKKYKEETETQAKGLIAIENGDRLDFICDYYDYEQNFVDDYLLGEPLVVSGELSLTNIPMETDNLLATFRFTDIYHNYYWSPTLD